MQAIPQLPQFKDEVKVFTSQPSLESPLQLAKPGLHRNPQVPLLHVGVAFAGCGQTFEHAPQCLRSVNLLTQLPQQSGVTPEQTVSHFPQLFTLTGVSQPSLLRLRKLKGSPPLNAGSVQSKNPPLHCQQLHLLD
jgi:hypothetical protein